MSLGYDADVHKNGPTDATATHHFLFH